MLRLSGDFGKREKFVAMRGEHHEWNSNEQCRSGSIADAN
jgi:hypothetical protein